jgi:cobyrinic acid a,c-diamide synthase
MQRLLVSAAHKSSGKTTLSIGLAAALRARGLAVQPFKKGPDFIDPLWLAAATGRPCRNLDLYLSTPASVRQAYDDACAGAEVALVEGNKGLYDGLALDGSNSNAALAGLLDLPVVLVLDARGMTRGVAPLILGYQAFDRSIRIAGVILNRLGGDRHEAKLRAVIEHYTDVPVLGSLQECDALRIEERHLGLMPATEAVEAQALIARLAEAVRGGVELDRLLAACGTPGAAAAPPAAALPRADLRVGVARDRAFGFYYPEDLESFRRAGAELVFFDTLTDAHLPPVDALFIGGGFPEVLAAALSANAPLRAQIRAAVEGGLPTYAECGGLMYLARSIRWRDVTYPMVGALPADVQMQARPVGRGYVHLVPTAAHPWPGESPPLIRAHEFHYSRLTDADPSLRYAYEVRRGHGVDGARDGIVFANTLASYAHLRSVAGHDWPRRFVAFARACRSNRAVAPARAA